MRTPHFDKLAAEGVLFERAFVQISICSPSRNSFLSGRYPQNTGTYNFIDHFRNGTEAGPSMIALPEFFRRHGYFTTGAGKVYHSAHPPNFDGNRSWSEPWPGDFGKCDCIRSVGAASEAWPPANGQASCEGLKPSVCQDDTIVETVVNQLGQVAASRFSKDGASHQTTPFFIAAGLHKPHMPFYAPQSDFALYDGIGSQPSDPLPPSGMPYVAWHSCRSNSPGENNSNWGQFLDIVSTSPNDPSFSNTAARAHTAAQRPRTDSFANRLARARCRVAAADSQPFDSRSTAQSDDARRAHGRRLSR
jgi:iduronate 2-sulfatase